jgi:hypothetical protein
MYDYYSHNPYRYEKQVLEGLTQFDFSAPETTSLDRGQQPSYLRNFWNNDENKLATANLGLGILGTIGNNLQYNREYKDSMRRRGDEYTQIPYDRNSYRSYATDFYQSYQTGGEVTDLWSHPEYQDNPTEEDPFSVIDEMFKDYPQEEYQPEYKPSYQEYQPSYNQPQRRASDTTGQYMHNYLQSKGLPSNVAAAILGNLHQESGLNPNAVGDNGASYGLAQWQGNRRKQLHQRYGLNPSVEQQLDFLVSEPGESKVLEQMRNLSPEEGAMLFAKKYERPNPKYAHYDKRQQFASQYK